jgi:hypothetical protein
MRLVRVPFYLQQMSQCQPFFDRSAWVKIFRGTINDTIWRFEIGGRLRQFPLTYGLPPTRADHD